MAATVTIKDNDPYDPLLLDDFETPPYLWHADAGVQLDNPEIAAGAPDALPGQGAYEHVLAASVPENGPTYQARIQTVIDDLKAPRPARSSTTAKGITKAVDLLKKSLDRDYWVDGFFLDHKDGKKSFDDLQKAAQELDKIVKDEAPQAAGAQTAIDGVVAVAAKLATNAVVVAERNAVEAKSVAGARSSIATAESQLAAGRADKAVENYRKAWDTATSATDKLVKSGGQLLAPSIGRDFAISQDWTGKDGLSLWYDGQNTGKTVAVELLDNRAPDPGPSGWSLTWSDEFDNPAGTAPDPAKWAYEIGDGTANGIPGWGNDELQYYTDSTDNAAADGQGNMVITAQAADGSLPCYYGPCDYTSARLLSVDRAEFAYGRIESRIQLPDGQAGLWPAFWSLGTDINRVGWPQTGEIDIMEYVSRIPDEAFGTIHGPGYSGGSAYGNILSIPDLTADYHTYAIEWEPDLITWYVDDVLYHSATPADVAPNPWVFNDPVYLLLNMAIGGNFGGAVSPDLTFPQEMKIDYVRTYQAADTAERFEAPLVDNFTGWKKVTVPFSAFTRSAVQPAGAPDDGLGLGAVWGYGFRMPQDPPKASVATTSSKRDRLTSPFRYGYRGWPGRGSPAPDAGPEAVSIMVDQVRLLDTTPPTVSITDDVDGETATSDVTFTFTFSEDVGSSFTADDVSLTGGTKGAFTRVDATHATLVAKPPADTTGTLEVSVAAGAFTDLAGNASTSAAGAAQAYVTPPPPSGGFVVTFDEPTPPVLTGFGGASGAVVADPTDAANKVAELTKGRPETWAGVTVSTGANLSVPQIPFSAASSTMTVRFWSPTAGTPVLLKVESASDPNQAAEVQALTTVAGGWETLSFDFAGLADPDLVYDKASLFPNFGTAGTGEVYYLDDLTYPPAPAFVVTFDEPTPRS